MLNDVYREKKNKNPSFSMNSFARYIGLTPSQFNEILQGKCGLSAARADQLANRLEFSQLQKRMFCLSVQAEHARSNKQKDIARKELKDLRLDQSIQLKLEMFSMVSSWYHFAILELMNLDDFVPQPRWIAKRINVDLNLVKNAIQRLKKLELIKVENGQWKRSEGLIQTTTDIPSTSIKKFHSQVLSLAEKSLFNDPVESREFNSVFLAVDKKLLPEAKKRIRKFQEKMLHELSTKSQKRDWLMGLNIQLYPIDTNQDTT